MYIEPNGVKVFETDEEFQAHLDTLPDGGVGVRTFLAAVDNGTAPRGRIVGSGKAEDGRGIVEFASAAEATEWASFCQNTSAPGVIYEVDGAKVLLPG